MSEAPSCHEGARQCSQCHEMKPAEAFGAGDPYRCLGCIRARVADWRLRRRQKGGAGDAARQRASARARQAVCARTGGSTATQARAQAQEVQRLISAREQRVRELRERLQRSKPEHQEASRQLMMLEERMRDDEHEADRLEAEIAALDQRLVGIASGEREYVRTADLARMLGPAIDRCGGIVAAADVTGVDRRALRGILDNERPLTTLRLADRVCTRLGLDLSELDVRSRDTSGVA